MLGAAISNLRSIGHHTVDAVWRIPITTSDVHVITAPDVAVRLPYLAALALAAVVTWVLLTLERGERRMITT